MKGHVVDRARPRRAFEEHDRDRVILDRDAVLKRERFLQSEVLDPPAHRESKMTD